MIMMCIRKLTWLVVFLYSFLVRVILVIDDLCFAVAVDARMRGRNRRCSPLLPSSHGALRAGWPETAAPASHYCCR